MFFGGEAIRGGIGCSIGRNLVCAGAADYLPAVSGGEDCLMIDLLSDLCGDDARVFPVGAGKVISDATAVGLRKGLVQL